jgi:hypothetical protein
MRHYRPCRAACRAPGIGQEATVLRAAVEQFLGTLHADSEERRWFERAA